MLLKFAPCCLFGLPKKVRCSGLKEAWIESGIIGPGDADAVLKGKRYKRAMRVHKITVQTL